MNGRSREEALTLSILEAVERQHDLTQRKLSRHLGVALGLTNAYLRRCVRKGWVKVSEAPANRYLYYLTPAGFAEKATLVASYLRHSAAYYARVSQSYQVLFTACLADHRSRVYLAGISEFAEIAAVRALDLGIEIAGVYDPTAARSHFLGKPVLRDIAPPGSDGAYVVTTFEAAVETTLALCRSVSRDAIFVPDILGFGPEGPRERGGAGPGSGSGDAVTVR